MALNWEYLDTAKTYSRIKLPSGWLVAGPSGMAFVPDATHTWDGSSVSATTTVSTTPTSTTSKPTPTIPSSTTVEVFTPGTGYKNAWTDYVFGGTSVATKNEITLVLAGWGALNLFHAGLNAATMGTFSFYVKLSAATPNLYISTGSGNIQKLPVPPVGVRTKIDFDMSVFSSVGDFTNIVIQPDGATTMVVDTITYTSKSAGTGTGTTTPTPTTPTPTPTTPTTPTPDSTEIFASGTGYKDSWVDYVFGGTSVATKNEITLVLNGWGALNLYHAGLNAATMGTLTFYVKLSALPPNLYISTGANNIVKLPMPAAANVRTKVEFDLSAFASVGDFTNLVIQPDAACTMVVDSISYTTKTGSGTGTTTPTTPTPTTPSTGTTVPTTPASASRWFSAYVVGYEANLQPPEAIDWTGITHVMIGRNTANSDGSLVATFDYDVNQGPIWAKKVAALATAAKVKPILMIGGSGNSSGFSAAMKPAVINTFAANLIRNMDTFGCLGVDLDIEPVPLADEPNLLALVKALRVLRPSMLITIPLDWTTASKGLIEVSKYCDQMNIMSYQMADGQKNGWQSWATWHSSALDGETSTQPSSIQKCVDAYIAAGMDPKKMGVGIGAYGSGWTGTTAPGQSTANAGVVAGDGELSYTNIMKTYYSAANAKRDTVASVPYISSTAGLGAKKLTFISYEDEASIAAKAAWCKAKGISGLMMWTLSQQYNATGTVKNPLVAAIKKNFLD